jgi:hypothetical protein
LQNGILFFKLWIGNRVRAFRENHNSDIPRGFLAFYLY